MNLNYNNLKDNFTKLFNTVFKNKAYTNWYVYLFVLSLFYDFLDPIVFIISCSIFIGWYVCLCYDCLLLKNKPFDLLYSCIQEFNKPFMHFLDIIFHIILPFISFYKFTGPLYIHHIIIAWVFSRLWSLVQSDFNTLFYIKHRCSIYNCDHRVFKCSYIIEHLILIIITIYINFYSSVKN